MTARISCWTFPARIPISRCPKSGLKERQMRPPRPQNASLGFSATSLPYSSGRSGVRTEPQVAMNYAGYEAVVQDAIRATEVATPAINHHRTRKIWTTVVCMFLVISVLAVVITGELRSIFVVGVVSIALGLLGSLMAALTPEKSASA
jgi:hypothetical protein